jgi:hypothetical protein
MFLRATGSGVHQLPDDSITLTDAVMNGLLSGLGTLNYATTFLCAVIQAHRMNSHE